MRCLPMVLGMLWFVGGATWARAGEPPRGRQRATENAAAHPAPHARWSATYHAGFSWDRPATVAESHARGVAALMRARAQVNLLSAVARIHAAQAHRLEMENRLRQIRTYFEAQQINQQARAAKRRTQRGNKAPPRD